MDEQAIAKDVPLKWTARGNVPQSTLRQHVEWAFNQKPDGTVAQVLFKEFWYFEDGELASNSVHVYEVEGMAMGADQGRMG